MYWVVCNPSTKSFLIETNPEPSSSKFPSKQASDPLFSEGAELRDGMKMSGVALHSIEVTLSVHLHLFSRTPWERKYESFRTSYFLPGKGRLILRGQGTTFLSYFFTALFVIIHIIPSPLPSPLLLLLLLLLLPHHLSFLIFHFSFFTIRVAYCTVACIYFLPISLLPLHSLFNLLLSPIPSSHVLYLLLL